MGMTKGQTLLVETLKAVFKPKQEAKAVTWIPRNVRLSPKSGNRPGLWSLNHTPFFKQILEDVDNPRINKVVIRKSAQIGLSILASSIIIYYICNHTVPIGYFLPSQEKSQEFCERALAPSIELCPAIKPFKTADPDDIKKRDFIFRNTIVRVIGSGSPSKLSSNSFGVVFADEIGKYKDFATAGESNALALAEARTESYGKDRKIFVFSTPTTESLCQITRQFNAGSQSYYFVPCPHCQHRQTLIFEQINWADCKTEEGDYDLDKVSATAKYQCIECKQLISNEAKIDMVRNGEWRATNPKPYPDEIRSYQISNLYSLNHTFGDIAKRFLMAGTDSSALQDFYNNVLGLPFLQRAATVKSSDLDKVVKSSPHYLRGELLEKPEVILIGCDTQGSSFFWAAEAIYANNTSSLIDWGEAQTFEDLTAIFKKSYPVRGTLDSYGAYKAVIDMGGNRTEQVKEFCVASGFNFIPVVGRNEKHGLFAPLRETTFHYKQYNIPGLIINDKTFKDILFLGVIKECNGKLFLPQDIDEQLRTQLTGSHLVQKKNQRGQLETYWKDSRNIHLADCLKYLEGFKYRLEPELKARREAKVKAEDNQKREYKLNTEVVTYSADNWN
jgi:phage terminase large subunit GpA-like protein